MDEIVIDNLRVFCNHGVYAEERSEGQNFLSQLKFFLKHILQVLRMILITQ